MQELFYHSGLEKGRAKERERDGDIKREGETVNKWEIDRRTNRNMESTDTESVTYHNSVFHRPLLPNQQ